MNQDSFQMFDTFSRRDLLYTHPSQKSETSSSISSMASMANFSPQTLQNIGGLSLGIFPYSSLKRNPDSSQESQKLSHSASNLYSHNNEILQPQQESQELGPKRPIRGNLMNDAYSTGSIELPLLRDNRLGVSNGQEWANNEVSQPIEAVANNQTLASTNAPVTVNNNSSSRSSSFDMRISISCFIKNLETIFYETPSFEILAVVISVSSMSGIAVSCIEDKYSHRVLFTVLYVLLSCILIEKILKLLRSYSPHRRSFLPLLLGGTFYNILDVVALIIVFAVADLNISGVLSSFKIAVYSLIALITVYWTCSKLPRKEKFYGIVRRCCYLLQLLVIISKIHGQMTMSWSFVLFPGWIVLAGYFFKLFTSFIQILVAFAGDSSLSRLRKSSKIAIMLGLALLSIDLTIMMVVLMALCSTLDMEEHGVNILKVWLTISQCFNAFLLLYVLMTLPHLIEFILKAIDYFNCRQEGHSIIKEFVPINQETFLLKISPTYYKVLYEDTLKKQGVIERVIKNDQEIKEENMRLKYGDGSVSWEKRLEQSKQIGEQKKKALEDNMCYICCEQNSNGVILDCGHGGVCYECLLDYLKVKDECMECRRQVRNILKIESEIESDRIFKSRKICKIMRM